MKKLTSEMVKEFAFNAGCGDIGIANIERFENAPRMMHPKNIFPDCKSVITIVQPIPRGSYRGITEGTHWANYTFYSYNRLNTLFRPIITYETACFIEDRGFEAVPVYPAPPECSPTAAPVAQDRPAPEVNLNVRIAAVACGAGEIGWSKVFLTRKFGPRVRLGTILTDAELAPDPLIPPGTLCNRCMRCAADCPGNAIPKQGKGKTIKIRIGEFAYEWADVHMGRCTLTHHGLNGDASPFLQHDAPGFDLDVKNSDMSEETAYKLCYPIAQARWRKTLEYPESGATIAYYNQIINHTGYFAICGARGCIVSCMDNLEKRGMIDQSKFQTPVRPRPQWKLEHAASKGGVAEAAFPALFNDPDRRAGAWE